MMEVFISSSYGIIYNSIETLCKVTEKYENTLMTEYSCYELNE